MSTPAAERKPLPFVANFAAGAIAGISEILTFYPLDVVKTRMQLETGKTKHGVLGSFKTIIKEEGFGRLYRGLVPPLLMEAPKRATKFAANDFWGKRFLTLSGEKKMTQNLAIATGCAAGATESFVVVPFELVKIKLQDKTSTFKGPMDVVSQVVKKEGLLGLYAGMEATMWRHFWWNGGYFGCIFQVRALLPKPESNKARLTNDLIAGTIGGLVVKSRIQGASKVPGVVPKYNWTYPALVTIFREEGAAALYKGFVPKVMRLAPGGGVLLLVVEFTLNMFRQALGPPYI
ncbi:mitochondrial carrier [Cubamyces sp. BRFM 1775]|nr:mitochondrial carrier [Cubamyces sp. BRFM 1775]